MEINDPIDKKTKPTRKPTQPNQNSLLRKAIALEKKNAKNVAKNQAETKKPIPQLQIDFDAN